MKAKELMIGDWVNINESNPLYARVSFVNKWKIGWEGIGDRDEEDIYPIPLTEDILKANGWSEPCYSKTGDNWHAWYQPYHEGGYEWNYSSINKNYDVRVTINYVHELQHALRLCGLVELADNFKVE